LYTIMGSLEYAELAKKHKIGNFQKLTQEEIQALEKKSKEIFQKLFPK